MFAQMKTLFKDLGSDMLLAITCTYISTTCKSIITTTVESLYLLTYVYIFYRDLIFQTNNVLLYRFNCCQRNTVSKPTTCQIQTLFYVPSYQCKCILILCKLCTYVNCMRIYCQNGFSFTANIYTTVLVDSYISTCCNAIFSGVGFPLIVV